MFQYYNPNPLRKSVGDCVVRALTKALDKSWDDIYIDLFLQGFKLKDMPSSNNVWASYLKGLGYNRFILPIPIEGRYSITDFILDHPNNIYIVGTGSHVATIIDGILYDSWDSSNEEPAYYFAKE